MEGKPFVPNRARKAYLVTDKECGGPGSSGDKAKRTVLYATDTSTKAGDFSDGKSMGRKAVSHAKFTDLTKAEGEGRLSAVPASQRNSYYTPTDSSSSATVTKRATMKARPTSSRPASQSTPTRSPCTMPLSAEERDLRYHTPVHPNDPRDDKEGDASVDGGAGRQSRMDPVDPDFVTPQPRAAHRRVSVSAQSSGDEDSASENESDKDEVHFTIGPHAAVERTASHGGRHVAEVTDSAGSSEASSPATSTSDASSPASTGFDERSEEATEDEDEDGSLAPQPPHHRRLEYTETTMVMTGTPAPTDLTAASTKTPSSDAMDSVRSETPPVLTAATAPTANNTTEKVPAITAYSLVNPVTPERPSHMSRYTRGVRNPSDLFTKRPTNAAPIEQSPDMSPGSDNLSHVRQHAGTSPTTTGAAVHIATEDTNLVATVAGVPTTDAAPIAAHGETVDVTTQRSASTPSSPHTAPSDVAEPLPQPRWFLDTTVVSSSDTDSDGGANETDGAQDLPCLRDDATTDAGSTDDDERPRDGRDSGPERFYRVGKGATDENTTSSQRTVRLSAKEEELPLATNERPQSQRSTNSTSSKVPMRGSGAVRLDGVSRLSATEDVSPLPRSRDETLPLDSSNERRMSSDEGGTRGVSSSYGCTEPDTTPGRSISRPADHHAEEDTDGEHHHGENHSAGPQGFVVAEENVSCSSIELTPSPSPKPCAVRFSSVERTVEGKSVTSLSAEEDGSVVRTRLTTGGVRLKLDPCFSVTTGHPEAMSQRQLSSAALHPVRTPPSSFEKGMGSPILIDPKASLPSYITDSILMRVEKYGNELLTQWQVMMVAHWTQTVVKHDWMPEAFKTIVGESSEMADREPWSPTSAPLPPPALSSQARFHGRSMSMVSGPAGEPLQSPQAPQGSAVSPRGAFGRSPASLSLSFRSAAYGSPTLMSPRMAATFSVGEGYVPPPLPAVAAPEGPQTRSPAARDLCASGHTGFVPMGGDRDTQMKRSDSMDTLADDIPVRHRPCVGDTSADSFGSGNKQEGNTTGTSADKVGERTSQAVAFLPFLFRMFCAADGDTSTQARIVELHFTALERCHFQLVSHAAFNVMYIEQYGCFHLMMLERFFRRHVCIERDLYMRDAIELFVHFRPKAAPKPKDNPFYHVKDSLTNFRKKLLLLAQNAKKETDGAENASEATTTRTEPSSEHPQEGTVPPPPPLSATLTEPPVGTLLQVTSTRCRSNAVVARSRSAQSRAATEASNDKQHHRSNDAVKNPVVVIQRDRSSRRRSSVTESSEPTSNLASRRSSTTQRRRRSYAREDSPLRLPQIAVQGKRKSLLHNREYVAPRVRAKEPSEGPRTPVDDDFMDLAYCRE